LVEATHVAIATCNNVVLENDVMCRMLIRWMLALVVLVSQFGCQFLGPISDAEPLSNTPPWIDLNGVEPRTMTVTINKTEEPNGITTFKVLRAYDPDAEDVLIGFWLLNHQTQPEDSILTQNTETIPQTGFNPREIREINFSYQLNHNSAKLQVGATANLELYLMDRDVSFLIFKSPDAVIKWPDGVRFSLQRWVLKIE
jgi:hypothetical protein